MKTIPEIQKEIAELESVGNSRMTLSESDFELNKKRKRVVFLRFCKAYLESCSPTEEILRRDLSATEKEIKIFKDNYEHWIKFNGGKVTQLIHKGQKPLAWYLKNHGIEALENKVSAYQYLLS